MSDTMTGASAIEGAIRASTSAGRPALAAFLTAGFPVKDDFGTLLADVAEVADVVEVGVPFSDPMADGVTIQASSKRALDAGVTLKWIVETIAETETRAPVLLMSYLNPLLAFGVDELADAAAAAGVAGFIVPDLPLEECAPVRTAFERCGLALIQLVTPVTPEDRLRALCDASAGFVYAVTVTGTTGGATAEAAALQYLDRVRALARTPVLAGFGIRRPEQVRAIGDHADGVIVGSALIEVLDRGGDPIDFLRSLRPNENHHRT